MPIKIDGILVWSVEELAEETGFTVQHVRRLCKGGTIRAVKFAGVWFIRDDAAQHFINSIKERQ